MLEKTSTSVKFLAFYTASKQGSTGLTVTIDIYDPSGTQIVTDGSATAIGGGLYSYTLSSSNSSAGEYVAIFKTTDANVDSQHVPSLWSLGRAGVENLDATVSSRLADADYTAPTAAPTVADIRTELATELGRIDAAVSTRATPADIPASDITAIKAKTDNLPAAPAAASDIPASDITAIKAKTDLLNSDRLANVATTNIVGTLLAQAHS